MSQSPTPLFATVPNEIDFPADERRILAFWKERRIFEQTLQGREGAPTFVFYEGPPTANGLPHNGHVLTRVIKDLFPRYKTMRGYRVPRKAGWDTHGLPVEVEVEKELRIHGKAEIERYGVEPFTERCIESVFRYTHEWERLTERIGFWVDLPEAYVTYHRGYVESVWWALAELFRKGLLYRGHKIVWWWPQGGTALSSGEVGMGYRTVDDPSAYVAFPLLDSPGTALLIWTTTPWTLPSNMYAAVNPSVDYVTVDAGERKLIIAAALREELSKKLKKELPVLETHPGSALVGRRYAPPYDVYFQRAGQTELPLAEGGTDSPAWRVIGADFVTLSSGTGIVHIAPAFGEDDYEAFRRERTRFARPESLEMFCAIRPDGTFSEDLPHLTGRFVKDADKEIQRELKERGLLVLVEQYRHEYPFCWRADDDPLIQFARPAWYIRTTSVKDKAIANNRAVDWVPEHIQEGRFGDFLANNVDWALSRERYWGTPLPLWVHSETGEVEAIPSLQALRDKPGSNLAAVEAELEAFLATRPNAATSGEHLIVHKPWIDKVTYEKPGTPGRFARVPEVVDVWFDSGCMPFAQWGYPHAAGSREKFSQAFPADFISEAIDQTRGWFYSLLMISTLVFDEDTQQREGLVPPRGWPLPYKSCIVLGHVSDKEGKKESKSKGNYTPPEIILDEVRMDFAVLDDKAAGVPGVAGEALIAREDLEGLDLQEGTKVRVFRPDAPEKAVSLTVKAHKKLKRRVVLLAGKELEALGVAPSARGADVMPVEVPRLAAAERVVLQDPATRAPGADAFRWFFYAASPTWSNTRHSLSNVRLLQKDFQVKLRNVYSFFTIYANIDGFTPARGNADATEAPWLAIRRSTGWREPGQRTVLDRWLLSEVQLAVRDVTRALDAYQVYEAAQRQVALVDALSNWYLRRSRERFWGPGLEQDKLDAYFTLYEALTTIAALSAPFVPFFAEEMWSNLVARPWPTSQPASVHLGRFPEADLGLVDEGLSTEMGAVRELVSLGLKVRTDNRLKVRQPLSRADVILARPELRERVAIYQPLIADELNVHEVRFLEEGHEADVVRYKVRPNLRAMGSRLGPKLAPVRKAFDAADSRLLQRELSREGQVALTVEGEPMVFPAGELEVLVEATPGYAAAGAGVGVVVLHTELTEALVDEGLVRELLARVQAARKDLALGYTDRIRLWVDGDSRVREVTQRARESISRETLALELHVGPEGLTGQEEELSLNGLPARLRVERA